MIQNQNIHKYTVKIQCKCSNSHLIYNYSQMKKILNPIILVLYLCFKINKILTSSKMMNKKKIISKFWLLMTSFLHYKF